MATRIYVGNLPPSMTRLALARIFGHFGEVTETTLELDHHSGDALGSGMVLMRNDAAARAAIENLDRSTVEGCTLRVHGTYAH
jgi:RNA recognition motif-containing protein